MSFRKARARYWGRWLSLCLVLIFPIAVVATDENPDGLAKIKTAYLYNIAKFVDWPGDQSTVFLCVHPDSDLQGYLQKLDARSIGEARELRVVLQPDMFDGCHIYYTDRPNKAKFRPQNLTVAQKLAPREEEGSAGVLSVSDHASALERGYAVQFLLERGKLRFRFSERVLAESSFRISSKLLVLASQGSQ